MSNGEIIDGAPLVVTEPTGGDYLPDVADIDRAIEVYDKIRGEAVKRMKKGIDYGPIPGTKGNTLLKPGAEKLCNFFGLAVESETIESLVDWDKEYAFFRVRTTLHSKKNGQVVATGIGSCNSREKKYRKVVTDGCLADILNTLEKMAQKRSHVDATLRGTGLSDVYTQDLDDMPPEVVKGGNGGATSPSSAPSGDHNPDELFTMGKFKENPTKWRDLPSDYLDWHIKKDTKIADRARAELARRGAAEGGKAAASEELIDLVQRLNVHFGKADTGSQKFWEDFKVEQADKLTVELCRRWLKYFESEEMELVDLDTFISRQSKDLGLA